MPRIGIKPFDSPVQLGVFPELRVEARGAARVSDNRAGAPIAAVVAHRSHKGGHVAPMRARFATLPIVHRHLFLRLEAGRLAMIFITACSCSGEAGVVS